MTDEPDPPPPTGGERAETGSAGPADVTNGPSTGPSEPAGPATGPVARANGAGTPANEPVAPADGASAPGAALPPADGGAGRAPTLPPASAGRRARKQPTRDHVEPDPQGKRLLFLSFTALGVVYGDIGTSTLYAMQAAFMPEYGLAPIIPNVYGILSLIVWALVLIVAVKYVGFILRADNRGEGGIFALLALILGQRSLDARARSKALIMLGLFGGAFLYGDGVITPAITVLGAVEGLGVAAPGLSRFVIPLAFVIISALFFFQYKGTEKLGGLFGWIMLAWFISIAVIGVRGIMIHPEILLAANPWYGVAFFALHPVRAFVVLGAVVLVVTGGEALYADMGHFGRKPIRYAWFGLVMPALLLNYFGQGALLLADPTAVVNPFYRLAPEWFLYPLVAIATLAAVVASQALISGAFSLTQQAVQLGYSPRVTIVHTSEHIAGQIYIPEVNKALAVGTLLLVLTFQSATALGAAYGVAVTGTMAITNVLFYVVSRVSWKWSALKAGSFLAFFLFIDLALFLSNLLKVPHGGWVPLAIAAVVFTLMTTWKQGRLILRDIMLRGTLPMDLFLEDIQRRKPVRVPGTAVFMTSEAEGAPVVLLHHLKHNKVLHERVVLLSISTAEIPQVTDDERMEIEEMGQGFYRVQARYGFMETPSVLEVMSRCREAGITSKPNDTSFYLGRESLLATGTSQMPRWRKKLFVLMARNARTATEFFGLPSNRVVEMGAQIEF